MRATIDLREEEGDFHMVAMDEQGQDWHLQYWPVGGERTLLNIALTRAQARSLREALQNPGKKPQAIPKEENRKTPVRCSNPHCGVVLNQGQVEVSRHAHGKPYCTTCQSKLKKSKSAA